MTERQALQALLLPSANNIAAVLARWDAGSTDRFVARMNATARSLGMTHTRYTDPSGYDDATVSTAADQVRIVDRAMRLPVFASIVATPSATLPVAGTVHNTNTLLGHDGFVGVKTGSDDAAGGCFAFRAIRWIDGKRTTITGVVLGQPGHDRIAAGLAAADAMVDRIAGHRAVPDPRPRTAAATNCGPARGAAPAATSQRAGGGAVESRTTSRVASSTCSVSNRCPSSSRLSRLTAVRPISASGWRTVVSAGVTIVACSTSSKPTIERSSGTRRPRARAAWIAPIARLSLNAKIAVGGSGSSKQLIGGHRARRRSRSRTRPRARGRAGSRPQRARRGSRAAGPRSPPSRAAR